MLDLLKSMVNYWHILIYCFFGIQLIKVLGNFYLKSVEIKTLNKNTYSFSMDGNRKELSITTSEKVHLEQIEKALSGSNEKIIELDFKKDKAS